MLNPPYLEGKIVAQYGDTLLIPYGLNRSVGMGDIKGLKAKIKTISTNKVIINGCRSTSYSENLASFPIEGDPLTIGQYYKIQLCFIDADGQEGYYSTVGVFKYTAEPTVKIIEFENEALSIYNNLSFTGSFHTEDPTEKEYYYRFDFTENDKLFYSTGNLIHKADGENNVDVFILDKVLDKYSKYSIQYTVITNNGLEISSIKYPFRLSPIEIPFDIPVSLIATFNEETGSADIKLKFNADAVLAGQYKLYRIYGQEEKVISTFILDMAFHKGQEYFLFSDYTVEQSQRYLNAEIVHAYQYAITQYYNNMETERLYSRAEVEANFEDIYLCDAERQLRIRFNPEISSFKTTLMESKLDTIGGKYPFVFRNARSAYKEFPISGLISYWLDNSNLDIYPGHMNLTGDNLMAERHFKLEVLDWLNNGKPKLFRSPTEGNYIVRLMNVSLAPEETLGRMLHKFSCTAYEVMECTYENLKANGIMPEIPSFYSFKLQQTSLTKNSIWTPPNSNFSLLRILYAPIGAQFLIESQEQNITIAIGNSESYNFHPDILASIKSIQRIDELKGEAIIEVGGLFKKDSYPLVLKDLDNNLEVISINYVSKASQYIGRKEGFNFIEELKENAHLFNILVLEVGVLPEIATKNNCKIKIVGNNQETILEYDLAPIVLSNAAASEPNRGQLTSYGGLLLTALDFNDQIFRPSSITIGEGLYANVFYTLGTFVTSSQEEAN